MEGMASAAFVTTRPCSPVAEGQAANTVLAMIRVTIARMLIQDLAYGFPRTFLLRLSEK